MTVSRILSRSFYHTCRPFVCIVEFINGPLYLKLIRKFLCFMGMNIKGGLGYVHRSVKFDDFSLISLGNGVVLSLEVHFLTHDWSRHVAYSTLAKCNTPPREKLQNAIRRDSPVLKEIKIGDNVFIGARSFILPGTEIGDNCIIGAGSVVRGKIPEGSIVIGNPGIIVGDIYHAGEKWIK